VQKYSHTTQRLWFSCWGSLIWIALYITSHHYSVLIRSLGGHCVHWDWSYKWQCEKCEKLDSCVMWAVVGEKAHSSMCLAQGWCAINQVRGDVWASYVTIIEWQVDISLRAVYWPCCNTQTYLGRLRSCNSWRAGSPSAIAGLHLKFREGVKFLPLAFLPLFLSLRYQAFCHTHTRPKYKTVYDMQRHNHSNNSVYIGDKTKIETKIKFRTVTLSFS